ncbi:MAG: DMT family transporter [Pseudoclavibacter sp.]
MSTTQVSSRAGSIGLFAAVGAAIAFAGAAPFAKPLLEAGWTPGGAVFVRSLLAALVLAPLVALAVRRDPRAMLRRWAWILAYGLLGIAGVQLLAFSSFERMPIGVSMLIQYMAPILLLLAAWARTRVRPAVMSLIGTGLAIAGLLCVLDLANGSGLDALGVAFAGLAALTMCAYFLIGANAPADLPPVALIGGGLAVSTIAVGMLGAFGIVPVAFDLAGTAELLGSSVPWLAPMSVVVIVGTVGAYTFGTIGAKLLGSRLASFIALLEVVATVAVAAVMLGEVPTMMQILGGVLILAGVIAVRLAPDHAKPAVDGGVVDIVGPITGIIPVPSQQEEVAVATGTIDLPTRTEGLAVVTGVVPIIGAVGGDEDVRGETSGDLAAADVVPDAVVADIVASVGAGADGLDSSDTGSEGAELDGTEADTASAGAGSAGAAPTPHSRGPFEWPESNETPALGSVDASAAEGIDATASASAGEEASAPGRVGASGAAESVVPGESSEPSELSEPSEPEVTTGSLIADHVEALAAVGEALFGVAAAREGDEADEEYDYSLPRIDEVEFRDDAHPIVAMIPIVQSPVIVEDAFAGEFGGESAAARGPEDSASR